MRALTGLLLAALAGLSHAFTDPTLRKSIPVLQAWPQSRACCSAARQRALPDALAAVSPLRQLLPQLPPPPCSRLCSGWTAGPEAKAARPRAPLVWRSRVLDGELPSSQPPTFATCSCDSRPQGCAPPPPTVPRLHPSGPAPLQCPTPPANSSSGEPCDPCGNEQWWGEPRLLAPCG